MREDVRLSNAPRVSSLEKHYSSATHPRAFHNFHYQSSLSGISPSHGAQTTFLCPLSTPILFLFSPAGPQPERGRPCCVLPPANAVQSAVAAPAPFLQTPFSGCLGREESRRAAYGFRCAAPERLLPDFASSSDRVPPAMNESESQCDGCHYHGECDTNRDTSDSARRKCRARSHVSGQHDSQHRVSDFNERAVWVVLFDGPLGELGDRHTM